MTNVWLIIDQDARNTHFWQNLAQQRHPSGSFIAFAPDGGQFPEWSGFIPTQSIPWMNQLWHR